MHSEVYFRNPSLFCLYAHFAPPHHGEGKRLTGTVGDLRKKFGGLENDHDLPIQCNNYCLLFAQYFSYNMSFIILYNQCMHFLVK